MKHNSQNMSITEKIRRHKNKQKREMAIRKILYPMMRHIERLENNFYSDLTSSFKEEDPKKKTPASSQLAAVRAIILLQHERERLAKKIGLSEKKLTQEEEIVEYKKLYSKIKNKIVKYTENSKPHPKNKHSLEMECDAVLKENAKENAKDKNTENLNYDEQQDTLTTSNGDTLSLESEKTIETGTVIRIYRDKNQNPIVLLKKGKLWGCCNRSLHYTTFETKTHLNSS